MAEIRWEKEVDTAMAHAREKALPLLLDFNAAPA